jgi:hypothetical protein
MKWLLVLLSVSSLGWGGENPDRGLDLVGGRGFFCLLDQEEVKCWGKGTEAWPGLQPQVTVDSPYADATKRVLLKDPTALWAGETAACAQERAGGIRCWGSGTWLTHTSPPFLRPSEVFPYSGMLCAVEGGVFRCWDGHKVVYENDEGLIWSKETPCGHRPQYEEYPELFLYCLVAEEKGEWKWRTGRITLHKHSLSFPERLPVTQIKFYTRKMNGHAAQALSPYGFSSVAIAGRKGHLRFHWGQRHDNSGRYGSYTEKLFETDYYDYSHSFIPDGGYCGWREQWSNLKDFVFIPWGVDGPQWVQFSDGRVGVVHTVGYRDRTRNTNISCAYFNEYKERFASLESGRSLGAHRRPFAPLRRRGS